MKKVFIVNTIGMGYEGISSVILNYLFNMDLSNLSVDIAMCDKGETILEKQKSLEELIESGKSFKEINEIMNNFER